MSAQKSFAFLKWGDAVGRHVQSRRFSIALDEGWENRLNLDAGFAFPLTGRPDQLDFRDHAYVPTLAMLPSELFPNYSIGQDQSKDIHVRTQGLEPTCTAQALATAIEIQLLGRIVAAGQKPPRMSARFLYEAARVFEDDPEDELPGSSLRGILKGFWHRGACEEQLMPYLPGLHNGTMSVEAAKSARKVTLGEYRVIGSQLSHFHSAIRECGSVLVTAMVHSGWQPEAVEQQRGTISYNPNRAAPVKLLGAHAFVIIGYTSTGFLVLNSWGPDWGRYRFKPPNQNAETSKACPGVALWTYADWERHVLNAWCFRLAPPSGNPSGKRGGFVRQLDRGEKRTFELPSVREADVIGHIIHIKNGSLSDKGLYASPLPSFQRTGQRILSSDKQYRHVVFFATGSFEPYEHVLRKTQLLVSRFKSLRIYPIFIVWQNMATNAAAVLLQSLSPAIKSRLGTDIPSVNSRMVEKLASPLIGPLWNAIKTEAVNSDAIIEAISNVVLGIEEANVTNRKLKFHLVAQGTGAIFALSASRKLSETAIRDKLETTTLLAPTCSIKDFHETFNANAKSFGRTQICTLPDYAENKPDDLTGDYGRSIMRLLSATLPQSENELLGITDIANSAGYAKQVFQFDQHWADSQEEFCGIPSHSEFLHNAGVLNHLLSRILNRTGSTKLQASNGGFTSSDLSWR